MTATLSHRGPDDVHYHQRDEIGIGFRRLSVIDLAGGRQPIVNEDGDVVLACNGEIFNHRELREQLLGRGHVFRTGSDVEVILHLYEEAGTELLAQLNGQFAFVIYDARRELLFAARDRFGIAPLFHAVAGESFLFASEIKALLAHPSLVRRLDPIGLDQVFLLPGVTSPRTLFEGVASLPAGHYLTIRRGQTAPKVTRYWDLVYPPEADPPEERPEREWVDELLAALKEAVRLRLQADVEVGYYLSGGLDSSLLASLIHRIDPSPERKSFSVDIAEPLLSESRYQRLVAERLGTRHHECVVDEGDLLRRLRKVIYHCECSLKESFNAAALALAEMVRESGLKVVVAGQGADELLGGYVGYRFDAFKTTGGPRLATAANLREKRRRKQLFGDPQFLYEKEYESFRDGILPLYSQRLRDWYGDRSSLDGLSLSRELVLGRHVFHQRSYVDVKLRLADHLLGDHGDRMCFACGVEARYPFLDPGVVEVVRRMPVGLKLKGFQEKYVLKKVAEPLVPREIIEREKFGFTAPGSPALLRRGDPYVQDLLSAERLRREGYFDADEVERLKVRYREPGFRIHVPFESDLLMVVITTGMLLDLFQLPGL